MDNQFYKNYEENGIAIVGIGCRFPKGANDTDKFWRLLENGEDGIIPIPKDRWDAKSFYNENRNYKGKTVSKLGGFIDDVDKFDALFFGITPREAAFLDPQQRILLQTSWEAMEDSGMLISKHAGSDVGVFMGAFTLDYKILQFTGNNNHLIDVHTATGSMMTMIANRISYQFDFTGPSMAVDTACSSSLVSIHLACQAIRRGECSKALAGGVLLNLAPQYTIAESQGGFLSVDGHCKTFDESANGYVRGEGAGVIVLKPLKEAIKDNDFIYSVILGSAVNQDGHTSSITVPNPESQKKVIASACKQAYVKPANVQYVEMHGTGTSVGDPLETEAVGAIFSEGREQGKPCVVGSVKTNIGHTEAAAGVASVIKTSLCLQKKKIPPILHLNKLNPKINLEENNIHIPVRVEDWPEHEGMAIAGVNGFGFGGTNGHILLGEAPTIEKKHKKQEEALRLYPITARSEEALMAMAIRYQDWLDEKNIDNVYDLGYSMAFRRDIHNYRLAVMAKDLTELKEKLACFVNDKTNMHVIAGKKRKSNNGSTFVFTGMGPQWWKMGRQLLQTEQVFKSQIEKCAKEFNKYADWDLMEAFTASEEESLMKETYVAQPANFAIQVALAELWKSKGIVPVAILGHSAGEIAAFYEAGAISFEDAVKIIYYRSSLQQKCSGQGKMLAITMSKEDTINYIKPYPGVDIVANNSNTGITLAGEECDLLLISKDLEEKGIFNKFLQVNVPFHSHYMEAIKEEFVESIKDIKFMKPAIPLYSTVDGCIKEEFDGVNYWWRNVRQTVQFASAMNAMLKEGYDCFVEIGPHPTLSYYIKEMAEDSKKEVMVVSSLNRKQEECDCFYNSFGTLFVNGYIQDLTAMYQDEGNYIKLPYYAWQLERYWIEDEASQNKRLGVFDHIILGHRLQTVEPIWEVELNKEVLSFIPNHKIQENTVFPAAAYIEMAMEAANQYYGKGFVRLINIEFNKATFINPNKEVSLQIHINAEIPAFRIYHSTNHEIVAQGSYEQLQNIGKSYDLSTDAKEKQKKNNAELEVSQDEIYERFAKLGFGYTNHFMVLNHMKVNNDYVFATIDLSYLIREEMEQYTIHPAILDACFQTVIATEFVRESGEIRLPVGVERLSIFGSIQQKMFIQCRVTENNEERSVSEITLYAENGSCIAKIEGFVVKVLDNSNKKPEVSMIDKWLYEFKWVEKIRKETKQNKEDGIWIILKDKDTVAKQIGELLKVQDEKCFFVSVGEQFSLDYNQNQAVIRQNKPEDIRSIINACKENDAIKGIVDCLYLDMKENAEIDREAICEVGEHGVYTLIQTVKGLLDTQVSKTKIWIVTKGAQKVNEDEESQVLQRPAWGAARLLRNQENTNFWGGVADLDPTDLSGSIQNLVEDMLKGDEEDQLAYRGDKRFVGRLNTISSMTKPFPVRLSKDDIYMITGAYGDLGKLVTDWMIEKGARNLVLVGRSELPDKEKWDSEDLSEKTREQITYVKRLEAKGVNLTFVTLDMSDENRIHDYFHKNPEIKNRIKGIISTAGIVRDMLMVEMPKEVFQEVYDTKTIGNWALHKEFENSSLDFFVLFSSITAIVTATGQINYISANSFLDGLADLRKRNGQPALSIAWGPWNEGMIKKLNLQEVYIKKGMTPITGINGISVLERILFQNISYALVVEADWKKVIESVPRSTNPYLDHLNMDEDNESFVKMTNEEIRKAFQDTYKNANDEEKELLLQDHILELLCKVLHVKKKDIEMESSLNELGMDSMMTTELKNRMEMNLGIVVTLVDLLNNQSIYQLISLVQAQLNAILELDSVDDMLEELKDDELESLLDEIKEMTEEDMMAVLV